MVNSKEYLSANVEVKNSEKTVTVNISENYKVSTMIVTSGAEYAEDMEEIWLSDQFAEKNDISIGDDITFVYQGNEISGQIVGLCKSSENMICVRDSNQLMPDYKTHGFAYITPKMLEKTFGVAFYPQINILSQMEKAKLEEAVKDSLGKTLQITDKELHTAYAGAKSEAEEGKTMGAVLPVLFLTIAILIMVTTMHRIASNEKVQIGTLKALGFRDSRILRHYTFYGLVIGLIGAVLGVLLGYGIVTFIMSPDGMMGTYFDLPEWNVTIPAFCIPVILLTIVFLTLISYLSTKKMLLIVGGLGMKDTMNRFLDILDDSADYATKINLAESVEQTAAESLCEKYKGDWQSSLGISYDGNTVTMDIYSQDSGKVHILNKDNKVLDMENDGVYLCLRLKDTAEVGDVIQISPYGSEDTYSVRVAGYFRSLVNESIAMTDEYADKINMDYHITSIYTDVKMNEIENSELISGKQDKDTLMTSYDTFMEIMNLMVWILIGAAVVLGIVVLYSLGTMSYVERRRELATLKVLGFRDKQIGRLLISQNIWLTLIGVIIGLPGGGRVLYVLVTALASEYEMSVYIGTSSCVISVLLTFGVSLFVSMMVIRRNKQIDMVEALKDTE